MAARKRSNKPRTPGTPRQAEILTYVRSYQSRNGYSPTLQEIGDYLGISKVTVFEHLTALEKRGLIQRGRYKSRSVELEDHVRLPADRSSVLPLIGRVAAGAPIEAIENPESVDLENLFSSRQKTFVLEVKGDSMIDDQICDGDYVVCEKRDSAENGQTVVALLDSGEATLKRLYRERGRFRLQPANSNYKPIYAEHIDVQGIVIGIIRRL